MVLVIDSEYCLQQHLLFPNEIYHDIWFIPSSKTLGKITFRKCLFPDSL